MDSFRALPLIYLALLGLSASNLESLFWYSLGCLCDILMSRVLYAFLPAFRLDSGTQPLDLLNAKSSFFFLIQKMLWHFLHSPSSGGYPSGWKNIPQSKHTQRKDSSVNEQLEVILDLFCFLVSLVPEFTPQVWIQLLDFSPAPPD